MTPYSGREHSGHVESVNGNTIRVSLDQECHNCSKRIEIKVVFTDIPFSRQKIALDKALRPTLQLGFFLIPFAGMIGPLCERTSEGIRLDCGLGFLSNSQYNTIMYAMNHLFAVVQGPPGTGKSTCIAYQAIAMARAGERVVVTTRDNAA